MTLGPEKFLDHVSARHMIPETTLVRDPKSRFWGPFLTKFWSKLEVFWGSWGLIVVSIGTRGSRNPWGLILSLWGAPGTSFITVFCFSKLSWDFGGLKGGTRRGRTGNPYGL